MKEKTKITLILGGIVLLVIGVISASFAFLSITKKQELANNFTSGCLNIAIENESNAITLSNTYPITDVEGLKDEGYTFTIKNTCSTSTNYQINLESLNQTTNTLDTQYIKTSLSSDTMDNLIQKLDSSMVTKTYIENAYVSHNLYKGTINGNSTKEFNLKLWIDYDTTKEQGASKTYTSKINVVANPNLEVETTPEIKTTLVDNTLEGTISGSATTVEYCITENNACTPNTSTMITDNKINIELDRSKDQIVCIKLNNGKTTCSEKIEKPLPITIPDIIANAAKGSGTPTFSKTACKSGCEETTVGTYTVSDPVYGGTTTYWRGDVTDNYVKFANFCWRIVRINGDGSIRLIYDGTTCHANGAKTTESIAKTSTAYNTNYNQSNYVGWTYSGTSQRTTGGTASNAKTQLESWYSSNITGTNATKVAQGKYCNDRNAQSGNTWAINGSTFYYAAYKRIYTDHSPSLACPSGDVYTLNVGLITADEAMYAGGTNANNTSYYLYNGQHYWTMSPYNWSGSYARVFRVSSNGYLASNFVDAGYGLRPVINLKADTLFATGGTGTQSNPYVTL